MANYCTIMYPDPAVFTVAGHVNDRQRLISVPFSFSTVTMKVSFDPTNFYKRKGLQGMTNLTCTR